MSQLIQKKYLCLEIPNSDKKLYFQGLAFGAVNRNVSGEVVFQTGMVGYPEALTDPSYKNQILVLTYPIIGSYGVPELKSLLESDEIQVAGLIVGESVDLPSNHWQSSHVNGKNQEAIGDVYNNSNIDEWLRDFNIPGIQGVDTRELTKTIRKYGTLQGHVLNEANDELKILSSPLIGTTLVNEVSIKEPKIYNKGGYPKILAIDCGMKRSQLRMMLDRGAMVKVVPWDYNFLLDFELMEGERPDGLFLSNGPGDPEDCKIIIDRLREVINSDNSSPFAKLPIFGICLGHQLLALAAGARSYKMKYGNRGHNIPCQLKDSQKCLITSQNHGYAIETKSLNLNKWSSLFTNVNDKSNEGIYHLTRPYYSVQFHPEGKAGPEDSSFLFDLFLKNKMNEIFTHLNPSLTPYVKSKNAKKLLVIGSGGLCIGQSGEFDYSGSQAIKAYKEEGLQIILVNPNVATVQTSPGFADKVYYLPIRPEYILKVIKLEHPDCVTLAFGGQTALNCGVELYQQGIFDKYEINILGSPIESVILTEDRENFKQHLEIIGEETIPSFTARTRDQAYQALESLNFPVLVRASYALGGLGSGFANNKKEFEILLTKAFAYSDQVIIDKSLKGWKEIEYEVVRDVYDNCVCVCNMENMDPLGVHTGESIVVAPSQTLNDNEYQMLRTTAIKTIRSLKIVGECNIQYALDTKSNKYYIVEVNARLSRSSALASKATGYPLAYVAAKLSLGYSLSELKNSMTKTTTACFEPSLDYLVVKVPRWDLAKFPKANTQLDSSMKSVGEAMAISRSFEEAFQKALRMANPEVGGFDAQQMEKYANKDPEIILKHLQKPTYKRVFAIATAIYHNLYNLDELYEITKIDYWFLYKMRGIINCQRNLEKTEIKEDHSLLIKAKKLGFSDRQIGKFTKSTELVIRQKRKYFQLNPKVKRIDTVAAEFPCQTNYLYTTYHASNHDINPSDQTIIVLGSGVYKIGSSVEFDWCAVNCLRELRSQGEKVTMINCNPETVSTDYDEADNLYFDELSFETVMDIYEIENPKGIVLSMGGQIPNNIAMALHHQKVNVLGTSPKNIDRAENRYKFSRLLDQINIDQPKWKELTSIEEAKKFCHDQTYPCLVRPSYVLSGRAMNVAFNDQDLVSYLDDATQVQVSKDHPIVISKFIEDAKEIEVDAVAENGLLKIIAISEHVENAGVHSGDATLIFPSQDLTELTMQRIKDSTLKIAKALQIHGPFNIQYIAKDNELKVIECNLRVSRTFPFVSKTMNYNMIQIATQVMLNNLQIDIPEKIKTHRVGVKVPMFSFSRLKGADISLGVEMVSTGEVACFGQEAHQAYLKGIQASDVKLPRENGNVLISIGSFKMKKEFTASVRLLESMGYKLYGTAGSYDYYDNQGINIKMLNTEKILDSLKKQEIDLVINISNKIRFLLSNHNKHTKGSVSDGYLIRRSTIDNQVPLVTDIKNGKLYVKALHYSHQRDHQIWCDPKIDCFTSYQTVRIPGLIDVHVHLREPGQSYKEDWETCTKAAIAGGVTMIGVMPNTDPPIVDLESQRMIKNIAEEKAHCDYGIYLGANSSNFDLWNQSPYLTNQAMALKLYLNNTYGPLLLEDTQVWLKHLQNWPKNRPICVHAEGQTLAGILHLANLTQRPIHICHVSNKEEILLIKATKEMGLPITCEVAPHHLFLTELHEQAPNLSPALCTVKPPLASQQDQQALWDNLNYIDCFATDHAPHTVNDKEKHQCPGFPGLETALPLLLTAVSQGKLTLDDIVERCYTNPKRIFDLPDQEETYLEVDLDHKWIIPQKLPFTKCGWSPFAGFPVQGLVRRVVLRGKTVYIDGNILSQKGSGQDVRNLKKHVNNQNKNILKTSNSKILELQIKEEIFRRSFPPFTTSPINNNSSHAKLTNLLTVDKLDRVFLRTLFEKADHMEKIVSTKGSVDSLKSKVMGSIFYEPSTRTRCSFNVAMQRLGGKVVEIQSSQSSTKKGESFSDFVKTMESYTDLLVIRTSQPLILPNDLSIPVINAGDGLGEHPTQALLDVYTMRKEKGTVTGKTIALVGDLRHSRTVHSLAKLLTLYQNIRLVYVSRQEQKLPREIYNYVKSKGVEQLETNNLNQYLPKIDILYMTRQQRERHNNESITHNSYHINSSTLTKAKDDLVIMHPLPRVDEISTEVDTDPRSAYFRQMENGLYVRMALLEMML